MVSRASSPLIIVGGGLAGCVAALALLRRRPEVPILLVEQGRSFGGNHIWSFFETDIEPENRDLADMLEPQRWPDHEVRFPARRRTIAIGYNSVLSARLDALVRSALRPEQYRLGRSVAALSEGQVTLDDGETLTAGAVIDARGPGQMHGLDLAWQKFVGRTYRTDLPHGCERPIIMDATVSQRDGYRFVYTLPFSGSELMVEDTYYSVSPSLDREALGAGLDQHVESVIGGSADHVAEETGVLPVLLGGRFSNLWPADGPPVARLGLCGGFFHPTTGYSLPDAIRNAALLATQPAFDSRQLHDLFRGRSAQLWKERRFFQLLNRMLFFAAEPHHRYRVLEHFYRLPEPLIGRFYAARLTALDKARILTGRPPVPIGRALASMGRRAA
ncbi:MAG: lycopene beta-cyclase CrtY [Pseudomonadota bacterium]|nr:lycopene beta-cyclase CrtY [Pseudomonadota bacterium]